jgi:hopanoid biosynthesis associated radical SAM protein HpnH
MSVSFRQQAKMASYILGKKLKGEKKYPLTLMLEPLFQCNLSCSGCGKIDYPKEILKKRMSVEDALSAVDECGAPMVALPGGEPLIHKEITDIVEGIIARKKYVSVCTNAVLLKKRLDDFKPSHYLTFTVHLDGLQEVHDKSVEREGVFEKATEAIKEALDRGFNIDINCTLFDNAEPEKVADFFDYCEEIGIEGIDVSPGYSYEFAPDQDSFLGRDKTKTLFRDIFREQKKRGSKWAFNHSSLFLDFLAGNQQYQCTPWSMPTYNIFGWQKPCYLLVNEGYAQSFEELMEETDWENWGTGRNPKCDNCMAHCGYEGTAAEDAFMHPLKALKTSIRGPKTEGEMAPDIPRTYDWEDFAKAPNPLQPTAYKEALQEKEKRQKEAEAVAS